MKLLNKILKKFNENFDNYFEIINFSFPVLFCVELAGRVQIGFVNSYKPNKGEVSFILANSEYNRIITCIECDTNVRDLFQGDIYKYTYDKGEKNRSMINISDLDQYLPSEELTVQGAFNYIDINELLEELRNEQQRGCLYKEIRLDESYTTAFGRLMESYNKTFIAMPQYFDSSSSVPLPKIDYINYCKPSKSFNIDCLVDIFKHVDTGELRQNINELQLTGYHNTLSLIKDATYSKDEYQQEEIPDYKFIPKLNRIDREKSNINMVV
ncbi:hypothetical protein [Streptococcus infantis]|uniref:hypothetical protein n=1 Tax=Streptococcus infantis TaxID=68892 RepID=UPI0039C04AA5